jgi:tetratricopeptide (TPR) repeat protein
VGPVGLALLALLAGLALGRFVFFSAGEPPAPAPAAVSSPAATISSLEARVHDDPDDVAGWQALGAAYVRESGRTGDPSLYGAAEAAFARADELAAGDHQTLVGRGLLALSLHRFDEALRLASLAYEADPYDDDALAVVVDASIELGRYDDAARHLDTLLSIRPGLAAYSRLSYLRELNGDVAGALLALHDAETAGAGAPYDVATVVTFRGDLRFNHGDPTAALDAYDEALGLAPELVTARIGWARALAAQGRLDEAIAGLEELTRRTPHPTALVLLGDLQTLDGRAADAAATYDLVRTTIRLQQAAGADVDVELALFEADHGRPAEAVDLARAGHAARGTVYAADALAWALRQAGDPAAALPYVDEALRLGTADALLHFHAATVFADTGQAGRAAAELRTTFDINPWFSFVHHDEALALAERLGVVLPPAAVEAAR